MVGTLLRLRFRVLANTLARNPFQLVAVILGGVLAGLMLLLALGGTLIASTAPPEATQAVTQMTPQRWTRACRGQFSGSRCGFGVMADGDLCQAATLRLFGFAFLSGEAFSKGGRAPGPGWT